MATPRPGTPEWWVDTLDKRLADRQRALRRYAAYYEGNHPLLFASDKFREAFGLQFRAFADNWCGIVVDAAAERLTVGGFRIGRAQDADKKAWKIWQRNQLDADSQLAHTEALIHGDACGLVWPEDGRNALITVESPRQVICAREKGNRRRRAAALKVWVEEDGLARATLYLPDVVYKLRSRTKVYGEDDAYGSATPGIGRWVPREVDDEDYPLPNPLGVVPVVPLVNNPSILSENGRSEIAAIIPVQDAVNKLVADMIIASEYGAFRQRWATGVEIPRDPDTKQPIENFKAAVSRLWRDEDPNAKFGEFSQTDLGVFVKAIEMLVQHIASQSRTPPHYLNPGADRLSGESIKAAETGLVAKVKRKQPTFAEGWEELMRLALAIEGDRRGSIATDMETIWGDPESRTESEHIDALVKQKAIGVPDEMLWEKVPYSPQEMARMRAMREEAAKLTPAITAPPAGQQV